MISQLFTVMSVIITSLLYLNSSICLVLLFEKCLHFLQHWWVWHTCHSFLIKHQSSPHSLPEYSASPLGCSTGPHKLQIFCEIFGLDLGFSVWFGNIYMILVMKVVSSSPSNKKDNSAIIVHYSTPLKFTTLKSHNKSTIFSSGAKIARHPFPSNKAAHI